MQNPKDEVRVLLTDLCTAPNAKALEGIFQKYYTPDARLLNPVCQAGTRKGIQNIFELYRIMSPNTEARTKSVMYDESTKVVMLEAEHNFHLWFSPFPKKPARVNVRLSLKEINGRLFIYQQEDLYHWVDVAAMILPPLAPIVGIMLALSGWMMGIMAMILTSLRITGGKYTGESTSTQIHHALGVVETSDPDKRAEKLDHYEKSRNAEGHDSPQPDITAHLK